MDSDKHSDTMFKKYPKTIRQWELNKIATSQKQTFVTHVKVLGGDLHLVVLHLQVVQLRLERSRVGQQTDAHVEAGQHTGGLSFELWRQHVITVHAREVLGRRLGLLGKDAANKQTAVNSYVFCHLYVYCEGNVYVLLLN